MANPIKRFSSIAVSLLAISAVTAVCAQTTAVSNDARPWPNKSITLVATYAAGGFVDTRMRLLARKLADRFGQPVVVENKVGAGGVIGTAVIAKAAPDGYTIGSGNLAPLAVNPTIMTMLPYNPEKDIVPIILIENSPLVLSVSNSLPVKNLTQLIALAKKEPGKLTFGSSGIGGAHHLSGEMFREIAKIDIVHVPYKGGAPASTDLMAGHLSMMFEMGYAALPAIKGGKIHPLAVTSTKRLALLPDVPTMAELGITDFESYNWQGIIAPAGTPAAIIAKLNATLNEILLDPDVLKQISDTGSQPGGGTPEDFAKFIRAETAKRARVIKSAKLEPQ